MIEQKQLEGLTFRAAKRKETTEDGRRKVTSIPVERPLKVADILSETEHGTHVTIVTKDGRKYDLPISAKTSGGKGKENVASEGKEEGNLAAAPAAGKEA